MNDPYGAYPNYTTEEQVLAAKDKEIERLKALDELNGKYIAQRDEQIADLKRRIAQMAALLDRQHHHRPYGSGVCYPDCPRCAWEKLKAGP
jgi:hypothetical protein